MSVKNEVLHVLELNKGRSISGQELADTLNVSRTAVWKAINSLKEDGYSISSQSGTGYSLSSQSDMLSAEGIRVFLEEKYRDIGIIVHKSVTSTNKEAKILAMDNPNRISVILAEEQSEGRGRFGRSFFSPAETGIYMSIILKPDADISSAVLITTAAAVSVCLAIDKFSDQKPEIKWVNDIYMGGKKVCGILTEAVTGFESGTIDSVVVGIGLNVKTCREDFPQDIQEKAGSIFSGSENFCTRNHLAAQVINNVLNISQNLSKKDFLKIYRERSMILGKQITYNKNSIWHHGTAKSIDDYGGLVIINEEGTEETLNSGEVSIRL